MATAEPHPAPGDGIGSVRKEPTKSCQMEKQPGKSLLVFPAGIGLINYEFLQWEQLKMPFMEGWV